MAEQAQQTAASDGADPEAVAQIAAGLAGQKPAEKPAPLAAALAAGSAAGEAKAAAQKPGGELTPNEEIRLLRDRLAKVEGQVTARETQWKAQEATEDFIRTHWDGRLPKDMVRKFLPVTADRAVLERESAKLQKTVKEMLDMMVQSGRIAYRNLGGSVGGHAPQALPPMDSKNPVEQIAMGLQNRR